MTGSPTLLLLTPGRLDPIETRNYGPATHRMAGVAVTQNQPFHAES